VIEIENNLATTHAIEGSVSMSSSYGTIMFAFVDAVGVQIDFVVLSSVGVQTDPVILSSLFDLLALFCIYVIVVAFIRFYCFIHTVISGFNVLHVKYKWINVTVFDRGLVSYDELVANAKLGLLAKAKSLGKLDEKVVFKIVNQVNFDKHKRKAQKFFSQILLQCIVLMEDTNQKY
jgi:hypothetical protein